ncbi:RIP metalloprotease RseP [Pseudomonas fluvialis]|uniref:Zinc metalloprotease n=1 Tax=Pseudomonas fluvialis TaxID=1793966 RepID=A0ABQ2AW62_9PSED|nr:RIP metalloprotease RseP [Pseudomonas fluvialis]OXM40185.1 RIP metalloprotease RseP [Pseudomonas fluvialis]GGH96836.1 zinc metalloprotease [Pseudomonas fluvialis]
MSAIYMLLGTLVALGVLVTIHEFGHFWVARRCGVKVLRFSVGFGTPLWRCRDRQDTEFVIAAIPLGGYVKMLDEREESVPEALRDQAFNRKPVGQRIAIVAAGPLANFLLALVFFWVLAMLGSQQVKPVVGELLPGSPAELAGVRPGEEIVAVDGKTTSGWSAVNLQLVKRLGETGSLRLELVTPGDSLARQVDVPLQAWLRGAHDPDPLAGLGIRPWRPQVTARLAHLDESGPAAAAGLRLGDHLLSLDGQPVGDWADWVRAIQQRPGEAVRVGFERDGLVQELSITLAERGQTGYLGAGVAAGEWPAQMLREERFGPFAGLLEGARRTWSMTLLTLDSLKKMLLGELSVKNLSGPITIAKVAGASAQSGLGDFLHFLAYLSISLGVLNLLPIPVLDGGHLLLYLVELVRGRPLSERVQTWGMQIGISLVIGVMLLALFNDLGRL